MSKCMYSKYTMRKNACYDVSGFPQLTALLLENTGVTDAGVITYAQSAPAELCRLDLSRTSVTHHILPALAAMPRLQALSIDSTQVRLCTRVSD